MFVAKFSQGQKIKSLCCTLCSEKHRSKYSQDNGKNRADNSNARGSIAGSVGFACTRRRRAAPGGGSATTRRPGLFSRAAGYTGLALRGSRLEDVVGDNLEIRFGIVDGLKIAGHVGVVTGLVLRYPAAGVGKNGLLAGKFTAE